MMKMQAVIFIMMKMQAVIFKHFQNFSVYIEQQIKNPDKFKTIRCEASFGSVCRTSG